MTEYVLEDNRIFVDGIYRASLEAVDADDDICTEIIALLRAWEVIREEADKDVSRAYNAGFTNAVRQVQGTLDAMSGAFDD